MLTQPSPKDILNNFGIKCTRQRELMLDILNILDIPLTVEALYLKLKEANESIDLSTVYRILELFAEKGLVIKNISSIDKKALFELNRKEHKHYVTCLKCKKNVVIDNCPLENFEKSIEKKMDFEITGHKVELYGYCPECKNNKKHI